MKEKEKEAGSTPPKPAFKRQNSSGQSVAEKIAAMKAKNAGAAAGGSGGGAVAGLAGRGGEFLQLPPLLLPSPPFPVPSGPDA